MRVSDLIRRSTVAIRADQTIGEAAEIMNSAGVGALPVMDGDRLAGIVTDRDLVRRGLAKRFSVDARVDAVMSTPVITVDADADAHDVYETLRTHPIRRLPVLRTGTMVGMVTVDDLIVHLAADLADLAKPVAGEVIFPQRDSGTLARFS